jgi:integrase
VPLCSVAVWLAHRLPDDVTPEQRELVREVVLSGAVVASGGAVRSSTLLAAVAVASRLPTRDAFVQTDAHALRGLAADVPGAHALLTAARRQPCFDPDGRFDSHLHLVGQPILAACPTLWLYPAAFAATLERRLADPDDRRHFVDLAEAVARPRIVDLEHRLQERVRQAVAHTVGRMVRVAVDLVGLGLLERARDVLPRGVTRPALVEAMARVVSRTWMHAAARGLPQHTGPAGGGGGRRYECLETINGAIRRGVFEPAIAPRDEIRRRELRPTLLELQRRWPEAFRCQPPVGPSKDRCEMVDADVEAMQAAVQACSLRYQAVFYMLYTLGLRTNAIVTLRPADVWNPATGQVRTTFVAVEKFSQRRRCVVAPSLHAALQGYLEREYQPRCVYLFGLPRNPQRPCRNLPYRVMRTVCRAAGVGPFHPHQFRRNIVRVMEKTGHGLAKASKFLGHRSLNVTFRSYFHVDVEHLAASMPCFGAPPPPRPKDDDDDNDASSVGTTTVLEGEMRRRQDLERQNAELRRLVEAWEAVGTAPRAPPPARLSLCFFLCWICVCVCCFVVVGA